MPQDTSSDGASAPVSSTYIALQSNEGYDRVELSKLSPTGRARVKAAVLINRHLAQGLGEKIAARQAARAEHERARRQDSCPIDPPAEPEAPKKKIERRASCMTEYALFVMAFALGEDVEHCAGLLIRRRPKPGGKRGETISARQLIADAVGISFKSTYNLIRDLADAGAARAIRCGGDIGDEFELIMPPACPGEEPVWSGAPTDERAHPEKNSPAGANGLPHLRAPTLAGESDDTVSSGDVSDSARTQGSPAPAGENGDAPDTSDNPQNFAGNDRARAPEEFFSGCARSRHCNDSNSSDSAIAIPMQSSESGGTAATTAAPDKPASPPPNLPISRDERNQCASALMRFGYPRESAFPIANHHNCNLRQIKIAFDRLAYAKKTGTLRTDEFKFVRHAIEHAWNPPPDDLTLLTRGAPNDAVATDIATKLLKDRFDEMRLRQSRAVVDQAPEEWINANMQELIRGARDEFERSALMVQAKSNPRRSCPRLLEIAAIEFGLPRRDVPGNAAGDVAASKPIDQLLQNFAAAHAGGQQR